MCFAHFSLKRKMSCFGKRPICNEIPSRGVYLGKWCFPLCIRCTGLVVGSVIAGFLSHHSILVYENWMLLLAVPFCLDIAFLLMTPWKSRYWIRGMVGFLFGLVF